MGASIAIKSDARQFIDQMSQITQNLKLMESELGVASTKAELFGTEQDKLSAQSKGLEGNLKSQNTLLGLYRNTITTLSTDIGKYKSRNAELSRSIAEIESKLKESIKSTGEDSKETKQLQQELSKLQKEYQSNEKAIERSSKQMDTYKIKMNESEKAILQSKKALEETDKKLSSMKWDDASKKLEGFGNKAKQIGGDLTTKVTLPIVAVAGASVKLASDMSESMNKVDVAFKSNSNEVKDWSNTTLEKFGIAKGTALDTAALFGDMGTAMGLSTGEASKMSMSMVGLAGDLSSFKNIGIEQAQDALKGIFTGEGESLKSLGIIMQDSTLKEYALSQGIKKKYEEMSQSEKVQLRYKYVMEQTKNAQGDFARTGDGVANQARVTKESIKQLSAEFGQNLLPMVAAVLKPLNAMLKSFTQMSPTGQKIVIAVLAITAIIPPLIFVAGSLAIAMSAVTLPMIGIGLLIGAIVIAGALLVANWDWIKAKAAETWEQVKAIFRGFNKWLEGIFNADWSKQFGFLGDVLNGFFANIDNIFDSIKRIFGGIIDFVVGIFTGDWRRAWKGVADIFGGIFDGLGALLKAPLNAVISIINGAIGAINGIGIHVPDWVPGLGGRSFTVNIGKIPYLWQGGIITEPTLLGGAVVGDAYKGMGSNAEAVLPLDVLWKQLGKNFDKLEESLGSNKQTVIYTQNDVYLDGEKVGGTLTKKVIDNISREQRNRSIGKGGLGFV